MKLHDILDLEQLAALVASHHISKITSPDGRHLIYDYTEKATYDRVWTRETTVCRGLVVRALDGLIMGRAFDKFHNLGEYGIEAATPEAVLARGPDYEIWDKMDGSMVLLWNDEGIWRTSTRGSFTSTQATDARAWIATHARNLDPDYCYIGEWIGPDNRIVVRYGYAEWVLTGVRSLITGAEADRAQLLRWAQEIGVRPCPIATFESFAGLLAAGAMEKGIEGWVLKWPDGFRVKVKTEEYLAIHRLISHLTPARIHEALCAGTYETYAKELPEEYRAEAERLAGAILEATQALQNTALTTFEAIKPLLAEGRKAFALEAVKHPDVRAYLFLLADGKPIEARILQDWVMARAPQGEERP